MTEIRREGGNLEERDEPRGSGCLQTGSDGDFLLLPHAPLAQNHEVAGSIPGTSAILNMDQVWNEVHLPREDNWVAI